MRSTNHDHTAMIVRLFLANVSPTKIPFPTIVLEDENSQLALLNRTVLRLENEKYPLSRKYRLAFLKEFINQVEIGGADVADALYETLASTMKENGCQESYFRIYQLNNGSSIRVCQRATTLSQGSTGLSHWQATYHFAQYVEENVAEFRNKKILELGCGLGLLGLAVVQLAQPSSYVFTDYNASVLRMVCKNIVATFDLESVQIEYLFNGQEISVNDGATAIRVQELDWTYWNPERGLMDGADMVLAADVAYDPVAIPDLAKIVGFLLNRKIGSESISAYIAHTIRNEATFQLLQDELGERNCAIRSIRPMTIRDDITSRTLPCWTSMDDFPCVILHVIHDQK